VKRLC